MAPRRTTVRAAGGVVWQVRDGRVEIALVHRKRYDDWSLPKGKLERGETELAAAVREVGEELGAHVAVSRRLGTVAYRYGGDDGTPAVDKTVAFWLMRWTGGQFVASDEVDEVQWLAPKAAAELLSYDVEREVLVTLDEVPFPDSLVVLVRHAKAGKRGDWRGDDALRPLERAGLAQADRLTTFLGRFAPDRVISAVPVRCVQTVTPLAAALGLEVTIDPVFSDDDFVSSPEAAEAALLALASPGRVTVVSSQGTTIPGLVESLAPWVGRTDTKKGAVWVLAAVDGAIVSADYYEDAPR